RATVSDSLGNSSSDVVSGIRIDNTAPSVVSSTPAEGSTVSSASSISIVTSEPVTTVGVTLDGGATVVPVISGTSITYATGPPGVTNGFGPGPEGGDVTARWALAGTEVHQFEQPVGILMRSTAKGLVPATFENGNWRVLFRVPTPGTLPAGWSDGFYTDGSGF